MCGTFWVLCTGGFQSDPLLGCMTPFNMGRGHPTTIINLVPLLWGVTVPKQSAHFFFLSCHAV